jgi:toxin YoeB
VRCPSRRSKSFVRSWDSDAIEVSAARDLAFDPHCLEDLRYWVQFDRNVALRVLELIEACRRDPFAGIGKPEPLKHLGSGYWSRRITQEHRLVYRVTEDRIDFLQARYHYGAR